MRSGVLILPLTNLGTYFDRDSVDFSDFEGMLSDRSQVSSMAPCLVRVSITVPVPSLAQSKVSRRGFGRQ